MPAKARGATTAARVVRAGLGVLLGLVARLWLATLRLRVDVAPELEAASGAWVLAFWHGTQWPLLAWKRRRKTVVMVSWSADGAMQARALALQGMAVVRGSSSKGGVRGLAALVRAMKLEKVDAAFAVDGPKGPVHVAKEGAIVAAKAARAVLVPMGAAVARGIVLGRTWDQFVVAWPFTRVTVRLGPFVDPTQADARVRLEAAIADANAVAEAMLGADGRNLGKLRQAGDGLDLDAGSLG